ncbi:MAG: tetratricopeptide repeat protein [Sedimentisphaerales bacterium]|nr:tetratricopeptide repeat protein [Sedimentisphaerales bacterium]
MSSLLEIFGRAIGVDPSDLIWHWLNEQRQDPDESVRSRHFNDIIDLMGNGKQEEASEQLRLYLFESPMCSFGRMAAVALYLRENRVKEAMEELHSVYMRQPHNTMALYILGHCLERLGHQAQAVEFYQDCLKFKDYLQLPAQRLGAIYFKEGRLDEAIDQYEPMKRHYPDDISTLVILGHLYLAAHRYAKAVETFNTAILIHPDNFMSQDRAVDALVENGELQEALDQLDVLLADQPDRPDLIAKQGDILSMLGNTSDAITQYQQALRICPDFLEATIKLGTNYLRMHAEQLAAQQFNSAVEINDKIVEAYTGLAAAQKLAGKTQEALNTLSLACAIQPNSSFLFTETAKLILKAAMESNLLPAPEDSRSVESIVMSAHQRHLERFPHNPDLHYRLGMLYMNTGQLHQACDCFNTALEINPTFARAATKLAVCLFETGREEQALGLILPVDQYDAHTLDLYYRTALLYCNRVKFASSVINLQRDIALNLGSNLDPATNISIVLQNLGLSDTVGVMWENLCETAGHVGSPNP